MQVATQSWLSAGLPQPPPPPAHSTRFITTGYAKHDDQQ
jgi:hypothetical protein